MSAEILLVRHGESAGNTRPEYICGQSNQLPLTERGMHQSVFLGPWLLREYGEPDAVSASEARRAIATGQIALTAAGFEPAITKYADLLERSQGAWTGLLREEVHTPEEKLKMTDLGFNHTAPDGETMNQVMQRMENRLLQLPDGVNYVFGHGLAIRAIWARLHDWTPDELFLGGSGDLMQNTSVTTVRRTGARLVPVDFARVDHLPEALRTT